MVGLLMAAYHVARFENHTETDPLPLASHLKEIKTTDRQRLLDIAADAVRENNQEGAAAAIAV